MGSFVSLGNKADVSSNDLLAAWRDDPRVTAAALYLESFGNAPKFARFARRFAERKPLLAVLGGRSDGGRRAGLSHTAAAATPAVGVDALFAQAGVISCHGAEDLAETALLLEEQPLPAGPRLGVLSNAGGMGVLAADVRGRARARRTRALRPAARPPLAPRAGHRRHRQPGRRRRRAASPARWPRSPTSCCARGEIDALVVVLVATGVSDSVASMRRIAKVRGAHPALPVVLVPMGGLTPPTRRARRHHHDAQHRRRPCARSHGRRGTPRGSGWPARPPNPSTPRRAERARAVADQLLDGLGARPARAAG